MKGLICRLFHYVRTIEEICFIDTVNGRPVGKYECVKCNEKFMAHSKNSWFRVKVNNDSKGGKIKSTHELSKKFSDSLNQEQK